MTRLTSNPMAAPLAPPTNLHFRRKSQRLELIWEDGTIDKLDTTGLREACLCSSCRAAKLQNLFALVEPVRVTEFRFLGIAGLQIVFSDGHERGVFPWRYLRELADK